MLRYLTTKTTLPHHNIVTVLVLVLNIFIFSFVFVVYIDTTSCVSRYQTECMFSEIVKMHQLSHPHLMNLIEVCLSDDSIPLILYCSHIWKIIVC